MAGVGDSAICGGSAVVDGIGVVEGVAGIGPWGGEHLSVTTRQNHLRLPNQLAKPIASAVKESASEEPSQDEICLLHHPSVSPARAYAPSAALSPLLPCTAGMHLCRTLPIHSFPYLHRDSNSAFTL